MRKTSPALLGMVAATAAVGFLAACSSPTPSEPSTPTADAGIDQSILDAIPADIVEAGAIKAGSSFTTVPLYYYDEATGEPAGIYIDLIDEIGARLNLPIDWIEYALEEQPLGVASGSIDFGAGASFVSSPENIDQFNVVGLLYSSVGLVSYSDEYTELTDMCGMQIGYNVVGRVATSDWDNIIVPACEEAGLPLPTASTFSGLGDGLLALQSGRVEGVLAGSMVGVPTNPPGLYMTLIDQFPATVYGLIINAELTEWGEALAEVISMMIEDGTYAEIVSEHGLAQSLWLTGPEFNTQGYVELE